ncbi:MAG: helix-turn-helix transcriptional regulator, partial [Clostridia bacterium]|nr:helix-turn-helix transcriptional regulator [Clostridia bacterium]
MGAFGERFYKVCGERIEIKSPLLLCFSASFIIWQMGVIFYSGTTLSLFGRTPIPLTQEDTTLVIAAGYLASIVFICLFPRLTVYAERAALSSAFLATALMLLPLSAPVITTLFFIAAFCCVFSIGGMLSEACHLFTVETTWRDGIIGTFAGGLGIALLQNDFFDIGFTAFTLFSLLLTLALAAFHFLIPARIQMRFAVRETRAGLPKLPFLGIWLLIAFSALLICLASGFAESVEHGVSVMYLSSAVFAVPLYYIRKKLGARTVKIYGGLFALTMAGFVAAMISLQLPALRLPACALLGFIVVLCNIWIFFAATSFELYPTRFIGALGAAVGMVMALLHAQLLDALRGNLPLMYGIYAGLSVLLMLGCYFGEPHFIRAWERLGEKPDEAESGRQAALEIDMEGLAGLSEQERILARLILEGHTESSIAREMNITLNTQKSYRKNLYAKLGIHSKRELFELAG